MTEARSSSSGMERQKHPQQPQHAMKQPERQAQPQSSRQQQQQTQASLRWLVNRVAENEGDDVGGGEGGGGDRDGDNDNAEEPSPGPDGESVGCRIVDAEYCVRWFYGLRLHW